MGHVGAGVGQVWSRSGVEVGQGEARVGQGWDGVKADLEQFPRR